VCQNLSDCLRSPPVVVVENSSEPFAALGRIEGEPEPFYLATETKATDSVHRAPNRTTETADRDKRASQLKSPLNSPVSGSESKDLNRQHPANSRAFPDLSSDPGGKSLHPQPGWRWGEFESELVSAVLSLLSRENTGSFSDFRLP
jgi:hypothetical protein